MPYFGVHESIANGFDKAVFRSKSVGFQTIQIFSANASRWSAKPIEPKAAEAFQNAMKETNLVLPLIHDSYLINLASVDPENHQKSTTAFTEELERANALGIRHVVMHPGSFKNDTRESGLARVSRTFDAIFSSLPPENETIVLIETTAGQGNYLGATFEEIAAIINACDHPARFGVCFDTCHCFAAGYKFSTRDDFERLFDEFDRTLGLEKLRAFHLNDSMKGLASHVDRHTHIGLGELGLEPFRLIVNDPRFKKIPMYLETPKGENEKGEDWDVVNLATLNSLLE